MIRVGRIASLVSRSALRAHARRLAVLLAVSAVAAVAVGPVGYADGSLENLAFLLAVVLAVALVVGLRRGPWIGLWSGLTFTLGFILAGYLAVLVVINSEPALIYFDFLRFGFAGAVAALLALAFVVGLGIGLAFGLAFGLMGVRRGKLARVLFWTGLVVWLIIVRISWVNADSAGGLIVGPPVGLGGWLGGWPGWRLGDLVGRGLQAFSKTYPYIERIAPSAAGFTVGYVLIVLWFAGCFASAHRLLDRAGFSGFSNLPNDHFWTFFYFSMQTMTTLGYTEIRPTSPLTQVLVFMEAIAGVGWTVVVFAGVIAYLEPIFAQLNEERGRVPSSRAPSRSEEVTRLQGEITSLRATLERLEAERQREKADRRQVVWWRRPFEA